MVALALWIGMAVSGLIGCIFFIPVVVACYPHVTSSINIPHHRYKGHSLSLSPPPQVCPERSRPLKISQRSAGLTSQDPQNRSFQPSSLVHLRIWASRANKDTQAPDGQGIQDIEPSLGHGMGGESFTKPVTSLRTKAPMKSQSTEPPREDIIAELANR